MEIERDPVTGRNTTGHEWDGIKELDTPIPRLVIWFYGLTAVFAVVTWVLYPAWPYISDFTRGALAYSSREVVTDQVERSKARRAAVESDLANGDLDQLVNDPAVRQKYEKSAAVLYQDNCAACHGRDLQGQTGFPNLTDKHWLWSGDVKEIETTLQYGINSGHDDERVAEMSAFGKQEMLSRLDVKNVVEYVLSISGQKHNAEDSAKGAAIFKENCASCHGDGGEGGMKVGAPSLVESAWIYGGSRETIQQTIWAGRKGVMPAWKGRLSDTEIRKLTVYVAWRSNGGSK